jgi:hypothetical protein
MVVVDALYLGQHVQAGRQQRDPGWDDGQLPLLGLGGGTLHPNDVTTSQDVHHLLVVGLVTVVLREGGGRSGARAREVGVWGLCTRTRACLCARGVAPGWQPAPSVRTNYHSEPGT